MSLVMRAVRIGDDQVRFIEQEADRRGLTFSAMMRVIIDRGISVSPVPYEIGEQQ